MKRPGHFLPFTLCILMLSACSKSPSAETEKSPATQAAPSIQHIPFGKLDRFKGQAPWDLVKDPVIGKEIRAVVPQSQFKCMDDLFNYMNDLSMESDGSVTANLDGSEASNSMEAFISVTPKGAVNVALYCPPQSEKPLAVDAPKQFQYFTNDSVRADSPKALLDWMYVVGTDGDTVIKADSKERIEMAFTDFVRPIGPANKPPEKTTVKAPPPESAMPSTRSSTAQRGGHFAPVGTVICLSVQSFHKVDAIETTGNQYASLPDDCMNLTNEGMVEIVQTVNDPVSGPVALVVNAGGNRAYVRMKDLQ